MDTNEQRAWLRLARARRLSAAAAVRLLRDAELPEAVFALDYATVAKREGAEVADEVRRLGRGAEDESVDRALAWLERHDDAFLLPFTSVLYPQGLLQSDRPPIMLFARGNAGLLGRKTVAVIGSEHVDAESIATGVELGTALVRRNVALLERTATPLELSVARAAPSGTILVLATGPDRVYPAMALDEQRSVLASGGLLLAEAFPEEGVTRARLERRDAVYVAAADAVLLVAAETSSSEMRLVRTAGEMGRSVFAVPGSIHSPYSKGPHRLIRNGATLAESAEDVLGDLKNLA